MRDWCSECQFENFDGSLEPCYNCVTAYNKKPSEFTPATDEVRGVGKWIERDDYDWDIYYECSVCHTPFTMLDGTTPELNDYHYCPNCGAKMEPPKEDADNG